MTEHLPTFGYFVFLSGLIWNVHRLLNNKINKSSGRLDKRIDKLDLDIEKMETKVVFKDVFEGFKETAEAKHESLEDMQVVLKESIKESSKANIKDHERLMDGISRQSEQISKLPVLIQTTIQNTLKTSPN